MTTPKLSCPNCEQWQYEFKGKLDCNNECIKRGFAESMDPNLLEHIDPDLLELFPAKWVIERNKP